MSRNLAISILRWTLGLVVLLESAHATLSASLAHHFVKMGIPAWAGNMFGGTEILAALMFLIPATSAIGGYLLLVVFGAAAAIHIAHGEADAGGMLIYGAAVLACIAHSNSASSEARHDG